MKKRNFDNRKCSFQLDKLHLSDAGIILEPFLAYFNVYQFQFVVRPNDCSNATIYTIVTDLLHDAKKYYTAYVIQKCDGSYVHITFFAHSSFKDLTKCFDRTIATKQYIHEIRDMYYFT